MKINLLSGRGAIIAQTLAVIAIIAAAIAVAIYVFPKIERAQAQSHAKARAKIEAEERIDTAVEFFHSTKSKADLENAKYILCLAIYRAGKNYDRDSREYSYNKRLLKSYDCPYR